MNSNNVDPKADNIDDLYSQQESPPSLESEDWEGQGEARPYNPSRGRRIAVVVAGVILAGAVLILIAMTMMQGSWWHSYGGGQALDDESWARVEAIWGQVAAHGGAPEAAAWLEATLAPELDRSTVRYYLLAAQERLRATSDQKLVEAAGELWAIAQTMLLTSDEETITPHPLPTLEGFGEGG